ncbi:MAG: hypothetical protein ACKVRP_08635 [Bacteroidota bacterium]
MINDLRQSFNKNFTEQKYQLLLKRLDALCGTHVDFRVSETPCFFPRELMEQMQVAGKEIIMQLMSNPDYLMKSEQSIPHEFNVPNESPHPLFIAVDFGLVRNGDGTYSPKLIEMQGFPTLFAYQAVLCQLYKEVYGLPRELKFLLSGLDLDHYNALIRSAVLRDQAPENVILMELDPLKQKTLPDFILTERMCGIQTVNIRDIIKEGNRLYYKKDGQLVPIYRIYNRAIAEELIRVDAKLPFSFRDDLHVEWAGHPNWFFRLSKFSLPYLDHPTVPKTRFLSEIQSLPDDLENWVLKPLYSFAGMGVKVSPTKVDIETIPDAQRHEFILQEKVEYGGAIETPFGGTKAEVRIMYIWLDHPLAVNNLVRMGRGKMMGVDHNKNMTWVGGSAGLYV